jgi:hypothetical protein
VMDPRVPGSAAGAVAAGVGVASFFASGDPPPPQETNKAVAAAARNILRFI